MHISILTFDGFNELDSMIALGILSRAKQDHWKIHIACPTPTVSSMNQLVIERQDTIEQANHADVVIIGSGTRTRDVVKDLDIMGRLKLDPNRQLIATQCSGALVMSKLGLLAQMPVCTDTTTAPWLVDSDFEVLNQAFYARGNIASAGGCLASTYLAAWVIAKVRDTEAAQAAIEYVAPVGEKAQYVERVMTHITPYLGD